MMHQTIINNAHFFRVDYRFCKTIYFYYYYNALIVLMQLISKSKKNLNVLLRDLPKKNQILHQEYKQLKERPYHRKYVEEVNQQRQKMNDKFSIIKASIQRKMESKFISNEEIIKECQSLNIKNIGRKYSEYKLREGLDNMQARIRMHKIYRSKSSLVTPRQKYTSQKQNRRKSKRQNKQNIRNSVFEQYKKTNRIDYFDTLIINDKIEYPPKLQKFVDRITIRDKQQKQRTKAEKMIWDNAQLRMGRQKYGSDKVQNALALFQKHRNQSIIKEDLFEHYAKLKVDDLGKIAFNIQLQCPNQNIEDQLKNIYKLIQQQ